MKKVKYLTLFVGLLVLTGCSERELIIDRVYPDTSSLEEAREKRQKEPGIEKEVDTLASTLKKQNKRPRSLILSSPIDTMVYSADVTQFCWADKLEECGKSQPIYPDHNLVPHYALYYLLVPANGKLSLEFGYSESVLVPFPTCVEAHIYDENKNLHLHEAIDNPGRTFEFSVPSKLGSYTFQFIAYYEGDVEGISYDPHGITVIAPKTN